MKTKFPFVAKNILRKASHVPLKGILYSLCRFLKMDSVFLLTKLREESTIERVILLTSKPFVAKLQSSNLRFLTFIMFDDDKLL